jgi:hypothetical protein
MYGTLSEKEIGFREKTFFSERLIADRHGRDKDTLAFRFVRGKKQLT